MTLVACLCCTSALATLDGSWKATSVEALRSTA